MDSFVYRWTNKTLNKIYIGYHKGTEDDGYVCSSASEKFWNDFDNPNYIWEREILHKGLMKECQEVENAMLNELDITSENVYNQRNNLMFNLDDEVRNKLSEAAKKRNQDPEYIEKLRQASKNLWKDPAHRERIKQTHTGKAVSEETRRKLREANLGKKQSKETIAKRAEKLKGHAVSKETKRKISKSSKGKVVSKEVLMRQYGICTPYGEFESISAFVRYTKEHDISKLKWKGSVVKKLKDPEQLEWKYLNE